MAARTYLIGVWLAAKTLYRYLVRYENLAQPFMTAQQKACWDATKTAVQECVQVFTPDPPVS